LLTWISATTYALGMMFLLIPIPIHNVPDETDGFFRLARRVRSQ
jgi:hypothetical protein